MLSLRKEVRRHKARVGARVSEDDNLRGPGDHVDADDAEHPPLRRRDVGIAGPDNLVDRGDGLRPVGECGDRLRAADPIDLVDANDARRR